MRTDAEVTAAAERTADLALRCAELTSQRDRARDIAVALEGQVAAVRALAHDTERTQWLSCYDQRLGVRGVKSTRAYVLQDDLRAALAHDPAFTTP